MMAVNATRKGLKLGDVIRNRDLDMDPDAFEIARFMADNIRSGKGIANGLRDMANFALEQERVRQDNESQQGMFGEQPTATRKQILERLTHGHDEKDGMEHSGGAGMHEGHTQRWQADGGAKPCLPAGDSGIAERAGTGSPAARTGSPSLARLSQDASGTRTSAGFLLPGESAIPTNDGISGGFLVNEYLGLKQSLTPEGFLVCHDVPIIARVGSQDYAPFELPGLDARDGVIVVERTPEVLFSPETLASFEGKPVTIDHPPESITPENWAELARGTVCNVRRGEGVQDGLMLADLLITDGEAIQRVRNKELTQTSNGYDADYEQIAPGRARQTHIVGNHVALVKNARCGPVCSIGDSKPTHLEGAIMAKKSTPLIDKLRKAFMTRDSDAFENAATEISGNENDQGDQHIHVPGTEPATVGPGSGEGGNGAGNGGDPQDRVLAAISALSTRVDGFDARLSKLEGGGTSTTDGDPDNPDDPDGQENAAPESGSDGGGGSSATTKDSAALFNSWRWPRNPGARHPSENHHLRCKGHAQVHD